MSRCTEGSILKDEPSTMRDETLRGQPRPGSLINTGKAGESRLARLKLTRLQLESAVYENS